MEIKNAFEYKDLFINKIEEEVEKYDAEDYYYCGINFDYCLEANDDDLKKIDFVMDNDKLICIVNKFNIYDLNFIDINLINDVKIYEFLSENYKDSIVIIDSYRSDEPFEYYNLANMENENGEEYISRFHESFLLPKYMDINILRDKIEKSIYPELNKEELIFENKIGSEILDELHKKYDKNRCFNGYIKNENGHSLIAGFHYFSLDDTDMEKEFLICKQSDQFVGVIKHGVYNSYNIPHQGLPYIDVNINYRNQGIAKMMVEKLNDYLRTDLPLFLTHESDMGKKCHMEKLFKDKITKTDCVAYSEQSDYYRAHKEIFDNYLKTHNGEER